MRQFSWIATSFDLLPLRKLRIISLLVISGLLAAIVYCVVSSLLWGNSYPNNTFLFSPADRFGDFYQPMRALRGGFAPYSNPNFLMPHFPFAMLLEYFFSFAPRDLSLSVYLFIVVSSYLYLGFSVLRDEVRDREFKLRLLAVMLLSYPFIFLIDRANFESFVYLFNFLFVYFYFLKPKRGLAYFALAAAISMKLFPAIFLLLVLSERDWHGLIVTIGEVLALTLLALALAHGGIVENLAQFGASQSRYFSGYIIGTLKMCYGAAFGHSVFGALRLIVALFDGQGYVRTLQSMLPLYNFFVLVYAAFISGYVLFVERVLWRKVALLVFAFNLLPYVSADYKLIHLVIPILLFVKSDDSSSSTLYSVLFGLMLIPKAYYRFAGIFSDSGFQDVSLPVIISPLLMLAVTGLIVAEGLKSKYFMNPKVVN